MPCLRARSAVFTRFRCSRARQVWARYLTPPASIALLTNLRTSSAGTKYFATSFGPAAEVTVSLALMMPSRHLRAGSNTPDPEFPVVATSLIKVGKRCRIRALRNCGEAMRELLIAVASATMTGSPGQGGARHNGMSGSGGLAGSLSLSTFRRLRSTSDPCLRMVAGKVVPAMVTLVCEFGWTRCAAVTIRPEPRYTPDPEDAPFWISLAVAIHRPFSSAPLAVAAKSTGKRYNDQARPKTITHSGLSVARLSKSSSGLPRRVNQRPPRNLHFLTARAIDVDRRSSAPIRAVYASQMRPMLKM